MSVAKIISTLFLLVAASAVHAQQTFTQTVTSQNTSCNATCTVLDIPALNNNPAGVVFATPVLVNGVNLNPHPIAAYYMYLSKWSIFNLDATVMPISAKFNVEYYSSPDATHFVYIVPQPVHANDIEYIDHVGLSGDPRAQVCARREVEWPS